MKTKSILLAFFLSLFTLVSFAQKTLYSEYFSSKGNWPVATNSTRSLEVKNGKYYFEHFRDDKNWNVATREIDINTNSDFEIEMSFQKISGNKSYATGLMYGTKDGDNTYHFVLSNDQYRVSEKKDGSFKAIKSWTKSSSIKTGRYDYNKLKIVKKGSKMYYYINSTLVTTQSFKSFFGKKLGILVYNKQKVAVDYFKVKQGSNTTTTTTQSKTILFEGFNNKNNNWSETDNSENYASIQNGNYIVERKVSNGGYAPTIKKYIDTKRNFRITAQIKHVSGVKNNGFGIVFGRKNTDNQNQFFITTDGSYIINKTVNGKRSYIKNWTNSSHIKKGSGAYNYLKVQKEGGKVKFYINSKLVYTSYTTKFYGDRTGFIVYDKQKISVGYLSMAYEDNKTVIKKTGTSEKIIWEDDFSANKNDWALSSNEKALLEVRNNKYYFDHKRTSGGWSSTKFIDIDESKDFEIESEILKISGIKNNGFGFTFGRKDSENQFIFSITANGSYSIDQYKDGKYTAIKDWTKSSHIKTGNYATNTLKIKKEKGFIKFYVNGRYLTLYTHKPFMGKRIGFIVYKKQKIAINNFKVKYINQKNTTTTNSHLIKESIIFDGYTSNKNAWSTTQSSDVHFEIKDGDYFLNHKKASGGWSSTINKPIDTSRDFKILADFKKISGIQNNGYGLVFGREDSNNQNLFYINGNGSFTVARIENGKTKNIKDWVTSSAIREGNGAYNVLKIIKISNKLEYYINNKKVYTDYNPKFFGERLGYIVYNKQKISIAYLSVGYIDKKKATVNTNTNVTDNISNYTYSNEGYHFSDQFTNNTNDWFEKNDEIKNFKIKNGKYYLKHKRNEKGWATYNEHYIDTSKDFEIETKIDKISGVNNYGYGLIFGKTDGKDYRFYISSSGYYKIARMIDNKEQIIKKWTTTSEVNTGNQKSNILKIKKENDYYKFYINNKFITQIDFEKFYGDQLGYVVYNNVEIAVDYLRVKYLKNEKKTIVKNNILKAPFNEDFSSNNNSWYLTDNTDKKTRIDGGKLYIKNKNEKSGAFISKKINIDTSKDFIIETSITRLTNSNASIAFAFGRKNNTNEFDLFLSKDSYLFRKLENDVSKKLIPWTTSSALNDQSHISNKVKIVKSGNLLRFYFNDQYINEVPYSEFFGNYIGYSVYNKQEVSIDYLKISYPTSNFNTPPEIVITEPIVQRGFKIVKTKKILVKGKATDKDGIYEIIINGVDANISDDGTFTANVPLKIGSNDLIVKATDLKQASSTKKFTIKRKSPDVVDDPIVVKKDKKIDTGFGKYYALLIGVSDYGDGAITDLGGLPTKDAQDLANVLTQKYNFNKENVVILNNSPKANDIIKEFSKLKKKVTNKDNLLVFYAGHGVYDEVSQVGHWLPSDADMEYELNLISNSQVVDFLKSIQSKHTLLISDACFSGSIFKTRSFEKSPKSIQKKYELTSRKAITSGTLKTVPNKSMFLKYLLKRLENNTNLYLSARQLFNRIEEPVMNNSPNTPQYGTIYGIGDEGGDFIFIKN